VTLTLPPPLAALETRLGLPEGSLEDEDRDRAEAAIEDATVLALAEVSPTLAERWQAAAPPVVRLVILKAARREYENPQGLTQETLGEHMVGNSQTSGVYLTASEVGQLRRAATGRTGGFVGTIRTPSAFGEGDTRPPVDYLAKYPRP